MDVEVSQIMTGKTDQWLQLTEIVKMFGLSEESIKRLAKAQGFPLRRLTPYATPGVLESELIAWLKAQPNIGAPVRAKRSTKSKRSMGKR
jgi:predicted DNA-binding transcriptional regulator AlpA